MVSLIKLSFLEVRLKMMSFLKLAIVRIWNVIVMSINVKRTFLKESKNTLMEIAGTVQFPTLAYLKSPSYFLAVSLTPEIFI